MKTLSLMLAAVLGGVATAQAADLSSPINKAQSYYPQSVNWTGFYFGLQLGGGFSHADWTDAVGSGGTPSSSGVLGGAQVGVNYQVGSWVFGLGGDFDGVDLHGSATDGLGNTLTSTSHWLGTVTGRLGYAVNRVLFYAKGGAAFTDDKNKAVVTGFTTTGSDSTRTGWTAGGGFEYAITTNWSALVEYDYAGFGSTNGVLAGPGPTLFPASINLNIQKVIAGVNYRF